MDDSDYPEVPEGKVKEELVPGRLVSLWEAPEERGYVVLLAARRVPVWDYEHFQLLAGAEAPLVCGL